MYRACLVNLHLLDSPPLDTVWDSPYSGPAAALSLVSGHTSGVPAPFVADYWVCLSARGMLLEVRFTLHLGVSMVYSPVTSLLMAHWPFFLLPLFVGTILLDWTV